MKLVVREWTVSNINPIPGRCPHCGREVILVGSAQDVSIGEGFIVGHRACPNAECKGHMFVVQKGGVVIKSYPPMTLDFNPAEIPDPIRKSFEEAITCHANGLFVAAAIMVRRTLEEICAQQESTGKDLNERIKGLRERVTMPTALLEGMNELRLLGNDAVHIESKTYEEIEEEELELAIQITKEILKALYQLDGLVRKLQERKKS